MADITVKLTDTQTKCLESIASIQCKIGDNNAIHNRARLAQEEIIAKLVAHCNENSIALAVGTDAQVTQAYTLKVVDTAKIYKIILKVLRVTVNHEKKITLDRFTTKDFLSNDLYNDVSDNKGIDEWLDGAINAVIQITPSLCRQIKKLM